MVGAGPAGADLACGLARAGVSVGLVERLSRPEQAAFSSAALPLQAVAQFGLPAQVVASRWTGWQLIGPELQRRQWQQPQALGVVLDFAALRRWQLQQVQAWGAQVQLGCTALGCEQVDGGMVTTVRQADGQRATITSRWVVDATGQARALLGEPDPRAHPLVAGVGLEWLLGVEPRVWDRWANRLSFMLGSQWVGQGYGWVFPMQRGQLKVGVCRLIDPRRRQTALGRSLEQLLVRCDLQSATVIDRHGGAIRSTVSRREAHSRGRLIGLGDAVSTANLLGGEGIRHALTSSRTLLPMLLEAIGRQRLGVSQDEQLRAVAPYRRQLRQRLGWRWSLSGRLACRTWMALGSTRADRRLERLLRGLEGARADELSALLFDYRFERYGWRALPYLLGLR